MYNRVVCQTSGSPTTSSGIIEIEIGEPGNLLTSVSRDKFKYVVSFFVVLVSEDIWVRLAGVS